MKQFTWASRFFKAGLLSITRKEEVAGSTTNYTKYEAWKSSVASYISSLRNSPWKVYLFALNFIKM